jgi:hypothetical protein
MPVSASAAVRVRVHVRSTVLEDKQRATLLNNNTRSSKDDEKREGDRRRRGIVFVSAMLFVL